MKSEHSLASIALSCGFPLSFVSSTPRITSHWALLQARKGTDSVYTSPFNYPDNVLRLSGRTCNWITDKWSRFAVMNFRGQGIAMTQSRTYEWGHEQHHNTIWIHSRVNIFTIHESRLLKCSHSHFRWIKARQEGKFLNKWKFCSAGFIKATVVPEYTKSLSRASESRISLRCWIEFVAGAGAQVFPFRVYISDCTCSTPACVSPSWFSYIHYVFGLCKILLHFSTLFSFDNFFHLSWSYSLSLILLFYIIYSLLWENRKARDENEIIT